LDAEPADRVRLEAADLAPVEEDSSRVGGEQAGDQIEQGRLAGAVRADDGMQPSARERIAQVVDRGEAAETLGQPLNAQDRLAHDLLGHDLLVGSTCSRPSVRGRRSVNAANKSRHSPTTPVGAKITTRIATSPTMSP